MWMLVFLGLVTISRTWAFGSLKHGARQAPQFRTRYEYRRRTGTDMQRTMLPLNDLGLDSVVDASHELASTVSSSSPFLAWLADASDVAVSTSSDVTPLAPPEAGGVSYSKASYYTILGLYVLSFPGLWSTIKRSTKAKMKRITYVSPGENVENGKSLRQQAGEIMACKCFFFCILILEKLRVGRCNRGVSSSLTLFGFSLIMLSPFLPSLGYCCI